MKQNGLDDGPPLPSQRAIDRACAKIESNTPKTDAERINWLEAKLYFRVGIGFGYLLDGRKGAFMPEIHFGDGREGRGYRWRTLRAAIDAAMEMEKP